MESGAEGLVGPSGGVAGAEGCAVFMFAYMSVTSGGVIRAELFFLICFRTSPVSPKTAKQRHLESVVQCALGKCLLVGKRVSAKIVLIYS